MKLAHAIRRGERLIDAKPKSAPLVAEDIVALTVLTRFAKRVLAARESVKTLHAAVSGDEDLNQEDLFPKEPT